jgi:hypothetical protein
MTDHTLFIHDAYDAHVIAAGDDGAKLSDSRAAVADMLAAAIRSGEADPISIDTYADKVTGAVLSTVRTARRSSLPKLADLIRAHLEGDGIIDGDEWYPELRLAYALGTGDGIDKALVHWKEDDWNYAVITRYRKAGEATAAAVEFDALATAIVGMLNGATTGDALGVS